MNLISLLDLVAALSSLAALVFILLGTRRTSWKPEITLFTFIIILTLFDNVGNFLEWTKITSWFDQPGDFLKILTAMLWAFFFYTYLQELTERRLREIQDLDEKILDGSPVAFVLHDLDLRVIRVSSAYEKVTGFKAEEVIDRTLIEFMPAGLQRDSIIRSMKNVLNMERQVGPQDIRSPLSNRHLRETILPVFDASRRLVNILSVLEDITEQKLARDALRESEARYRMLFDNIHDGVVLHDIGENGTPGRFLEVNAQFCTMTGYSRKELLKMTPLELVSEEQLADNQAVRVDLLQGRSTFFERNIITKAGDKVPCEFNAHSLILANKPVILSVVRDITERKEARDKIRDSLAEKETLLREIHHRVKNNLQVISGLLNLQSHYINDEEVRGIYKESQNRIKTMALIHEELYQRKDLARINLADYIQGLAENLMTSYSVSGNRIRLTMDLADADIALDTAIPCGLIINELVSNALKHAFPEGRTGDVKVSLRCRGEDSYELTVSDNGVGLPDGFDYTRTSSMGMQLVVVLAQQLNAKLEYRGESGTDFSLTFREYREAAPEVV